MVTSLVVMSGAAGTAVSSRSGGTLIKTAYSAKLKKTIVVDAKGRTLYLFTADKGGKATCAQADPACPTLWPAVPRKGKPAGDAKPGDANGQAFFGVWYVLSSKGQAIK